MLCWRNWQINMLRPYPARYSLGSAKGSGDHSKKRSPERIIKISDVFDFEISREDMQLIASLDGEERRGAHPDKSIEHFGNK